MAQSKVVHTHVPIELQLRREAGAAAQLQGLSYAEWVRRLIQRELSRAKSKGAQ